MSVPGAEPVPAKRPAMWGEMMRALEQAQKPEQPPCCVFVPYYDPPPLMRLLFVNEANIARINARSADREAGG